MKELVRTPGSVVSHRSLRIPDEASRRPVRVQVTVRTAAGVGGCAMPCLLALRCCVPSCFFWWRVFPCCRPPCDGGGFRPGSPVCFLFLFVFPFVFRVPVSCLVVLSPMVLSALWCVCCRAVPCWRARAVWFVGSLCCLALLAVLFAACSARFFFVPVCRAFWCGAALCCCSLCAVHCAGPLSCPAVWCVAGLRPVVLWCCLLLGCVVRLPLVLCRAGLGCFPVVVCLPVLFLVVRFVAVLLLFVALSPVLARCLRVWRWRALRGFLWCVVLFLLVLCLVARLVPCCGVPCWSACFLGVAVRPGCLVLSSGGVLWRWCPCLAAWSVALSLGALASFPVASWSPVLCLVVLCCRLVLCCWAICHFWNVSHCVACALSEVGPP